MVPDGGGVGHGGDRQNILQKIDGHTVGNEGSPLGFEIEQFGGGVFSQEPGQRTERLGLRRVAPAAVKARARKRHVAEGSSEDDTPLTFALQAATAEGTPPAAGHVGRCLRRDQLLLDPAEQSFGLVKRQAQHFESIFALIEADDGS
jgi:hypothetical protein